MSNIPVTWGSGASQRQIQRAVEEYFRRHPPQGGTATDAQVSAAVADYLRRMPPPPPGKDGQNATDAQITENVAAYMRANPPAAGRDGMPGPQGTSGKDGAPGARGEPGTAGKDGMPGVTLLRQVSVGETTTLAITLGIVDLQYACAGAVIGERYEAYVRAYRLNGGALIAGQPTGYWVVSAHCRTSGTINVAHMRPALSVGASYELLTDIVRING